MSFESMVKRVRSLPALSESLMKIEELYAQGQPEAQDLVKIIESDPVLTANILAKVNAPFYGFSKNIVSIFQAVILFGPTTIRGFALSSFVDNTFKFNMEPYRIDGKRFKEISALQSSFMFQWYMRVNMEDAKSLIPISFLLEVGKIIIAKEIIENSDTQNFSKNIKEGDNISKVEEDFVGISSSKVNTLLFDHWNFNDLFVDSMLYLDNPSFAPEKYKHLSEALDVVQTCINIKEVMSEESLKNSRKKVKEYNLSLDIFDRTVQRWRQTLER